jgi:hypothetical protein
MSAKLGRVVRANRGRETLQRLGFSTKTPRPQHAKADVDAQDLFKKTFPEYVHTLQSLVPAGSIEFWAMDEHRIGLKPILRRVWATRGVRPRVLVHHRYQWSYVYGFVHPPTGRTFWLLVPTVSNTAFSAALDEFAAFCQAGPAKRGRTRRDLRAS